MTSACLRFARLALPVFLLVGGLPPHRAAAADAWSEPKFNPPVGSKWTIERELNVEKNSGGTMVGHTLKQTALLTVEEKTADGYVMSYARQGSSYEGDPGGASIERIAYAAEQGVVMRIETDASGKPLRIVNFDEVKAALKTAINELPMNTANPDIVSRVRAVADKMVSVDDKQAAELYVDDLPLLALGQNTGLNPGDMRKLTLAVPNALVSDVTKVLTLSIEQDNPAEGKVRYLMTETFDPDSMKTVVGETIKELALTQVNTNSLDQVMKSAIVVAVARAEIDVAGGMTREMRRQSHISFRAPGAISVTDQDELVTITPAE